MTEYPNKGANPLTNEEREKLNSLTNHDAIVLALAVINQASRALTNPGHGYNAAARSCGFENDEHEVMAFLSSDWFDLMIDSILESDPNRRAPVEYAQDMIDHAYGQGQIEVVPGGGEEIRRREGRRPRGMFYVRAISETAKPGDDILDEYNHIIALEQVSPDLVVILVPLTGKEQDNAEEICCVGPPIYSKRFRRSLQPHA